MELREFAERVLFATTLEEKLHGPGEITDDKPGTSLSSPTEPGRPLQLQFKKSREADTSFSATRLDQEHERGKLLHSFANHELLATELMALVLLRFPEAPPAFRRGVLQTLKDEQEHTRLYLERMRACGIEFGELPVSGYFWRAISGMENPIDYVAGLSLTFEQANLDFARHFSQRFAAVGDAAGAALLERIYKDEIVHVAYGLKWFRRWKKPGESDWTAFCRQLKYPLSPQRAKGFAVNVDGRRAAGLDPVFIAELDIYSQSKGRTPAVFHFNPFAEGHLARGRSFSPVKHQTQLALDLANLPQFVCRQDDVVLVPKRPSVEFLSGLKQAGFALPEFVELGQNSVGAIQNLSQRKLGQLRPWAWGPDSAELLAPLAASVTHGPPSGFHEGAAKFYSKAWSADFLREFLAGTRESAWLCPEAEVGVAVDNLDDALRVIASIRGRGHHRLVVKEAFGLAGGNAIRLWEPAVLPRQIQWMTSVFDSGHQLVIEPWLERVADFSVQFEMSRGRLKLCGFTGLLNDPQGQFRANYASPQHGRRPPSPILSLIRHPPDAALRLPALYEEIGSRLETHFCASSFTGPVGIDAFIYRDGDGRHRLKPVVEINPRYTMGRVTLELMARVCPGRHGLFRLVNRKDLRREGFEDFTAFAAAWRKRSAPILEGEPVRRISEGSICLNDPAEARVCLAVFQVARELADLIHPQFAL